MFRHKNLARATAAAFVLFVKAAEDWSADAKVIHEVFRRLEAAGEPLPPGARRAPAQAPASPR